MATGLCVTLMDVHDAAARICGHVRTTPLLESPLLDDLLGFRLLLKAESLQYTGSFKARGAFNQVLQLTGEEMAEGIVAFSSGNHAQGVAYAASRVSVPTTILMPHDAPKLKMRNTQTYGAEIVTYNRETEDRYVVGERLVRERGGRLIHSYEDPRTIAGQGTVGLEIFKQARELCAQPDAIVVNCCGGGLASGIAVTLDLYENRPGLFTAEPQGFDDARLSLATGEIFKNERTTGSICDALLMPSVGLNNFRILRHHKARGLAASDEDVMAAMSIAHEHFGLVLEPSGAVGLACTILNRAAFQHQTAVVVASGGNVDPERYADMLIRGRMIQDRLLTPFPRA